MAYQLKLYGLPPRATRYATIEEAREAAHDLADEKGEAVTVIDATSFPRAKSLKGTIKSGAKKRVSVPVARKDSAANVKRPKRIPSKAEALSSLFRRNPTLDSMAHTGDYWFAHPVTGALVIGRNLATMAKKAQALATQTGRRVAVNYQKTERDHSLRYKGKAKPMRRNPVSDTYKRANGKWAKITKRVKGYTVAMGWEGYTKASKSYQVPSKTLAAEYANGWVND